MPYKRACADTPLTRADTARTAWRGCLWKFHPRGAGNVACTKQQGAYQVRLGIFHAASLDGFARIAHARLNLPTFKKMFCSLRKFVEHFFNKLKHFIAIATRYNNHRTSVKLASLRRQCAFNESVTYSKFA
jgi:hypothetical protein